MAGSHRDLDYALEEALLLGLELDLAEATATVVLSVPAVPESDDDPAGRRFDLVLCGLGGLVASLRDGPFHDEAAVIVPVSVEQLPGVVASFRGLPVYGGRFFDDEERCSKCAARPSVEWDSGGDPSRHSLALSQDAPDRCLGLCFRFERLRILDGTGRDVSPEELLDTARRFWKALKDGDPRTRRSGIVPLD